MTGAPNGSRCRDKGARAERAAVAWLREHGWPDARRYLAGDGRQPGDLDFAPGIAVDVKARRELAIPAWLSQAETEAGPNRLPLLWVQRPGLTDPGDWWAVTRWRHVHQLLNDERNR